MTVISDETVGNTDISSPTTGSDSSGDSSPSQETGSTDAAEPSPAPARRATRSRTAGQGTKAKAKTAAKSSSAKTSKTTRRKPAASSASASAKAKKSLTNKESAASRSGNRKNSASSFPRPSSQEFASVFSPKEHFGDGQLEGWGGFHSNFSKITSRFVYAAQLRWEDESLLSVRESLRYCDGRAVEREYSLHFAQSGAVSGQGQDIVGGIRGAVSGDTLGLGYRLLTSLGSRRAQVRCQESIVAIDDRCLISRTSISWPVVPFVPIAWMQAFLTRV